MVRQSMQEGSVVRQKLAGKVRDEAKVTESESRQ